MHPELKPYEDCYFQFLLGIIRRMVELGQVDIVMDVYYSCHIEHYPWRDTWRLLFTSFHTQSRSVIHVWHEFQLILRLIRHTPRIKLVRVLLRYQTSISFKAPQSWNNKIGLWMYLDSGHAVVKWTGGLELDSLFTLIWCWSIGFPRSNQLFWICYNKAWFRCYER